MERGHAERVRLSFIESAVAAFLSAPEGEFVVISRNADPDEYVQLAHDRHGIHLEVGSREWRQPKRPLGMDRVAALSALGLRLHEAHLNYCRLGMPATFPWLARYVEACFRSAYGVTGEFDTTARFKRAESATMCDGLFSPGALN